MSPMRKNKRIAIVCGDTLRAVGLRNLLASYFAPVETDLYPSPQALESAPRYDFCFLDADFADRWNGGPSAPPVMILGGRENPSSGGTGPVLDTTAALQELVEAVGNFFAQAAPLRDHVCEFSGKSLTEREIQVLQQVVRGAINKEIADRLSISFNTVLTHRKNIAAKTGIKTVSGLTFYALLNGYVSPSDIEF